MWLELDDGVRSLEQPVKGKREEYGHGCGEEIAQNAKAEECLVRSDVVGSCACIPGDKHLAGMWMRRSGAVRSVR
jgi:hypothetical protein